MRQVQETPETPIDQAVNGWTDLYARQVDTYEWRVLSLRNGSVTAHKVQTDDLSCTCADEQYNKDDPEVCDHVATALFQADQGLDVGDYTKAHLTSLVDRAQAAVTELEELKNVGQANRAATAAAAVEAGQADAQAGADPGLDVDPVEGVEDWLETGFGSPEHVDVREGDHDGTAGVVLEPDNQAMADGQYEAFKALVNNLDGSTVHVGFGDDPCNTCGAQDGEFYYHVPAADVAEVLE